MTTSQMKSNTPSRTIFAKLGNRLRRPRRRVLGQTLTPAPTVTPVDPLVEIGTQLQTQRQQQSKTLEEISAQTLVPMKILTAIEAGQSADLPEPVFVKGMIRRYADALDLNGTELAARYAAQPSGSSPPKSPPQATPNASPVASPMVPGSAISGLQFRPIYLYLLYVAVLGAACGGLYYLSQNSSFTGQPSLSVAPAVPATEPVQSPTAKTTAAKTTTAKTTTAKTTTAKTTAAKTTTTASTAPSPSPVASPAIAAAPTTAIAPAPEAPKPAASGTFKANLSVKEESWMQVVADGKTLINGVLTPGSAQTITAQKNLKIRVGNAGGVLMSVNDQPSQVMGKRGIPKDFVWQAKPAEENAST